MAKAKAPWRCTCWPLLNAAPRKLSGIRYDLNDRKGSSFRHEIWSVVARGNVESIILLAKASPVSALSNLLKIPKQASGYTLNNLHAMLDIQSIVECPVRLFQLFFHDFLIDLSAIQTRSGLTWLVLTINL